MADYFFKIFTSLRNCNVACSPALRLGGASEQLSGLCLQKVHRPLFKVAGDYSAAPWIHNNISLFSARELRWATLITLYASAVIYGREPPQWCDALCLVLFLGRMRLALARSPPSSLSPPARGAHDLSLSLSPPCAQILNYCFGIWCHHS